MKHFWNLMQNAFWCRLKTFEGIPHPYDRKKSHFNAERSDMRIRYTVCFCTQILKHFAAHFFVSHRLVFTLSTLSSKLKCINKMAEMVAEEWLSYPQAAGPMFCPRGAIRNR